jgi:ketosteroid isomerase-like protein
MTDDAAKHPAGASPLRRAVQAFRTLLEQGKTVEAVEQYYAVDVCVFENRELARAGRAKCLAYEREQLARQPKPPEFRFKRVAVDGGDAVAHLGDESTGVAFLEYVLRFTGEGERPQRLELVAAQSWEKGKIVEERFYYEGVVDEGD